MRHGLLWVSMITSAENRRWPEDVLVSNLTEAGLPSRSVVRCAKIATIDSRDATKIGSLPANNRRDVRRRLSEILQ